MELRSYQKRVFKTIGRKETLFPYGQKTHPLFRYLKNSNISMRTNLWKGQRSENICGAQAGRFFRRLLKDQGREPRWLVTDKVPSYGAAHRAVMPTVEHLNAIYANNRVEGSHQPTRQQEYHMRGFSSATQAQRFLTLHGLTQNLFRLGRHLMQAVNYRLLRTQAFQVWREVVCA
jgi:putative transposase